MIKFNNMNIHEIFAMPYGKERRKGIIQWIEDNPDRMLYVNNKYQFNTKKDQDLKKLIKSGKLKTGRLRLFFSNHHQTILILP